MVVIAVQGYPEARPALQSSSDTRYSVMGAVRIMESGHLGQVGTPFEAAGGLWRLSRISGLVV